MPERQPGAFERIAAAATSITTALGAIVLLAKEWRNFSTDIRKIPVTTWGIVGVLLLVALVSGRRLFARSRLLRRVSPPRPERPEDLKGREDDVRRLAALCLEYAQVNLVGESGAGKTALVRGGLLPALVESPLVALYVNTWGRDWDDGPRNAVILAAGSLRTADLKPPVTIAQAADAAAAQGKRLLLIFDQFDDYQNAHLARFRSSANNTFLPASALVESNTLWREVKDLLGSNRIHCMFVTRADTAAGLESVRFVEPLVYPLDRLRPEAVTDLFDSLMRSTNADAPLLADPERGWPSLRDRLVRDLSKEGYVLPIQMSLAIAGLGTLPYLTVREYERHGGVSGLEAADIEWRSGNAARRVGVSDAQALKILASMVDPVARKTRGRTFAEIRGTGNGMNETDLRSLLADWETKDLLRRRADPSTGDEVWMLDHDYLSNGVLAAEARATKSSTVLRESEQDHRASGRNLWRRWRTLLSPSQQISLFRERLRGGFRYAERRGYALLSLVRFVPFVVLIAGVVLVTSHQIELTRESDARALFASIGSGDPDEGLTATDIENLWSVSRAPRATRAYFITEALKPGVADRLVRNFGPAIHAAVGFDSKVRDRILPVARQLIADTKADAMVRLAALRTVKELDEITVRDVVAVAELVERSDEVTVLDDTDLERLVQKSSPAEADLLVPVVLSGATDAARNGMLESLLAKCGKRGIDAAFEKLVSQGTRNTDLAMLLYDRLDEARRERIRTALRRRLTGGPTTSALIAAAKRYGQVTLTAEERKKGYDRVVTYLKARRAVSDEVVDFYVDRFSVADAEQILRTERLRDPMQVLRKVDAAEIGALASPLRKWTEKASISTLDATIAKLPPNAERFRGILDERLSESIRTSETLELLIARSRTGLNSTDFRPGTTAAIVARLNERAAMATNLSLLKAAVDRMSELGGDPAGVTARVAFLLETVGPPTPQGGEKYDVEAAAWAFQRTFDRLSPARRDSFLAYFRQQLETSTDADHAAAALEAVSAANAQGTLTAKTAKHLRDLMRRTESLELARAFAESGWRANDLARTAVDILLEDSTEQSRIAVMAIARLHQLPDFGRVVEQRLDTAPTEEDAQTAAELLFRFQEQPSPQMFMNVARKPTCSGSCLVRVYELAKELTGGELEPNRWSFVKWAATRKVDLRAAIGPGSVTKQGGGVVAASAVSKR